MQQMAAQMRQVSDAVGRMTPAEKVKLLVDAGLMTEAEYAEFTARRNVSDEEWFAHHIHSGIIDEQGKVIARMPENRVEEPEDTPMTPNEYLAAFKKLHPAPKPLCLAEPPDGFAVLPGPFAGRWVAWTPDWKWIVASAKTLKAVSKKALAAGYTDPVFERIPTHLEPIQGQDLAPRDDGLPMPAYTLVTPPGGPSHDPRTQGPPRRRQRPRHDAP